MTILKIIFLSMLCLPIVYLAVFFLGKLINEVKPKGKEAALQTRDRMRNVIDSDRNRYNQSYYQTRMDTEVGRRNARRGKGRNTGRER